MRRIFFMLALIAFSVSVKAEANSNIIYEKQGVEFLKTNPKINMCEEWTWFHLVCPPGSHGEGYFHYIVRDCVSGVEIGRGWYGRGCVNDEEEDDDGGGVIP